MSPIDRSPLKDVARRAVQAELVSVAQQLFEEHGYEATTVDLIAATAGMSRRTFFRYFSSKEDVVLEKYALLGELMEEELRSRPVEEPLWDALRAMFTAVSGPDADEPHAIERVVDQTPSLRGGYLFRLESIQRGLVEEARRRAVARGAPYADDDPTPDVLVGAAFAAMTAARGVAVRSTRAWPEIAEEALSALAPSATV